MDLFNTTQLKFAYEYVEFTSKNIFLTGKAGTGKTTFLRNLKKVTNKRMIIVAPTGVAAINAGGVTIHSFFQLPFSPYLPTLYVENITEQDDINTKRNWNLHKTKIDIIRSLDLLVIDEISMVRADLLDQIDAVLRRYKNKTKPFGGVQLLMIGDLKQLAPIVKDDEWIILHKYYQSIFFFDSKAINVAGFIGIELSHIFRQQDNRFISILNKIRDNQMTPTDFDMLSERYIPNFRPDKDDGYITLTTHNYQAQQINNKELSDIDADEHKFEAKITGTFPEYSYPTEVELVLKEGAQVMFVKNDPSYDKLYYNGKIGKITKIKDNIIYVKCPTDEDEIAVEQLEWQNVKYTIDQATKAIREDVAGVFTQYPLKLAWAITIHKSQGLTFEKAIIDANAAFAHGQVYVALSRCKTLQGLILSSKLSKESIIISNKINDFTHNIEQNQPSDNELYKAKQEYELLLLLDLFDFNEILIKLYAGRKTINIINAAESEKLENILTSIITPLKTNITEVADKFANQCRHLYKQKDDLSSNEKLQERIIKACNYFYEKINELQTTEIVKLNIETDNNTLAQTIVGTINEVGKLCRQKLLCLKNSKNGFEALSYLNCRSMAALDNKKSSYKIANSKAEETVKYIGLYNRLKEWRNQKVEETDLPYYMVIQLQSMREISNHLPLTMKGLAKIRGIGKKKIEDYGHELLEIITQYATENNLTSDFDKIILKKSLSHTALISLDLFKEGKTIAEIAQERGYVEDTVYGHLSQCVKENKIGIEKLIEKEKVEKITEYFEKYGNTTLTEARQVLGDLYSWNELRCVKNYVFRDEE